MQMRLEADLALPGVDQPGANVLRANVLNKLPDSVIIDTCSKGAEEVNGLAREGVHNLLHFTTGDTILLEDTHADTNAVLTSGGPVEFLHTPITNKRGIQGAEVITCTNQSQSILRS